MAGRLHSSIGMVLIYLLGACLVGSTLAVSNITDAIRCYESQSECMDDCGHDHRYSCLHFDSCNGLNHSNGFYACINKFSGVLVKDHKTRDQPAIPDSEWQLLNRGSVAHSAASFPLTSVEDTALVDSDLQQLTTNDEKTPQQQQWLPRPRFRRGARTSLVFGPTFIVILVVIIMTVMLGCGAVCCLCPVCIVHKMMRKKTHGTSLRRSDHDDYRSRSPSLDRHSRRSGGASASYHRSKRGESYDDYVPDGPPGDNLILAPPYQPTTYTPGYAPPPQQYQYTPAYPANNYAPSPPPSYPQESSAASGGYGPAYLPSYTPQQPQPPSQPDDHNRHYDQVPQPPSYSPYVNY